MSAGRSSAGVLPGSPAGRPASGLKQSRRSPLSGSSSRRTRLPDDNNNVNNGDHGNSGNDNNPRPGNRFVSFVLAGEAKLRGRARGMIPSLLGRNQDKCSSATPTGWRRWPEGVPRFSPCFAFWGKH